MSVWKFLLWLSLVLFGGFATIIFVLVVALDGPSCGEESPSVALARGLGASLRICTNGCPRSRRSSSIHR